MVVLLCVCIGLLIVISVFDIITDIKLKKHMKESEPGIWITNEEKEEIICSKCNFEIKFMYLDGLRLDYFPYCPYCGNKKKEK